MAIQLPVDAEDVRPTPDGAPVSDFEEDAQVVSQLEEQLQERAHRPWWRRPTPWWQVVCYTVTVFATALTLPAKLEIINLLVCQDIRGSSGLSFNAFSQFLDEDKQPSCATDPKVQTQAAAVFAAYMVTTGICSCTTAPIWGTLSDRHGRVFVQRIYAIGPLLSDLLFILLVSFASQVPGGSWAVVLAGMAEGLFGVGTLTIAQSYIADTADADSTSRWFALFQGAFYCGNSLGPLLASIISHYSGLLVVFYAAIAMHIVFLLLVWLAIPESLLPAQIAAARQEHVRDLEAHHLTSGGLLADAKKALLSVVEPLEVFLPSSESFTVPPVRLPSRAWNLTLIVLAYFPDALIVGAGLYYIQYGVAIFGWRSEQIGVTISVSSGTKSLFLTVILPLFIKAFRPNDLVVTGNGSRESSPTREGERIPLLRSLSYVRRVKDRGITWDLNLARISLLFAGGAVCGLALAKRSVAFNVAIASASLGSGFLPTVQSFALEAYRRRGGLESGKLFGALAVVQVLGAQILGPIIFGFVFAESIEQLPKLIFVVSGVFLFISFLIMLFVHVPHDYSSHFEVQAE
ncbi:MFS general substrate transporter [Peniophora sp. CONT]|nr:MFS general substrate transporter [Peniophora sp. CONT]